MYSILSDKVKKQSKAESLAHLVQNNKTQVEYQRMINDTKECNADVFRSYKSITRYRDEHCTPLRDGKSAIIIIENANEIICPLEDLLAHQFKKLFEIRPELKEKIETLKLNHPEIEFRFVFKYGM